MSDQAETLRAMARKIAGLERERKRSAWAVGLIAIVALAVIAAIDDPFSRQKAGRYVMTDTSGDVRAEVAMDGTGRALLTLHNEQDRKDLMLNVEVTGDSRSLIDRIMGRPASFGVEAMSGAVPSTAIATGRASSADREDAEPESLSVPDQDVPAHAASMSQTPTIAGPAVPQLEMGLADTLIREINPAESLSN